MGYCTYCSNIVVDNECKTKLEGNILTVFYWKKNKLKNMVSWQFSYCTVASAMIVLALQNNSFFCSEANCLQQEVNIVQFRVT